MFRMKKLGCGAQIMDNNEKLSEEGIMKKRIS